VKDLLWGGEFWGKGYFMNTVGQHGSESLIAEYVRMQGNESRYECFLRRWCNWISSLEYLAGAKRQSTDRERACPGDALLK